MRTTVSDGTGRSSFTDTTVTVNECGLAPPSIDTVAVTPDTTDTPYVGTVVDLLIAPSDLDNTGDCSLDQDVTLSTAFLAKPVGSQAVLAPSEGPTPAFTADASGTYTLRITATDDLGLTSTHDVDVTVDACGEAAPTIAGSADVTEPDTGQTVEITWTASDTDNTTCSLDQALTIESTLIAAPAGSETALSPTTGPTVAFTPDTEGTYIVRGSVTDDTGRSTTQDVTVAAGICGDQAPTARVAAITPVAEPAATSISVTVEDGVPVGLSAAGSTDPDDGCPFDELSYWWWFTAVPFDSTVQFNDPTLEAPSFFPDLPGTYEITVEVTDGKYTSQATATVVVDPALHFFTTTDFDVAFVAGATTLWDEPRGVDVDPSGDILVAHHEGDRVTLTDPVTGATSTLSAGGFFTNIEDVLHNPTTSEVLVSNPSPAANPNDYVVRVSATGEQALFGSANDPLDEPFGLALDSSDSTRLAVADEDDDRIEIYDADLSSTSDLATHTGGIQDPWGLAVAGDDAWVADRDGNELRWVGNDDNDDDDDRLVQFDENPADVILLPSTDLLVTVPELGAVYAVEQCTPDCTAQTTLLAWGPWEPWGLAVESDTEVLVTDADGDALYRITGDFTTSLFQ